MQSIFKAADDPINLKQNLKVLKPGSTEVVDIKFVLNDSASSRQEVTGWEKLKHIGIHQEHIERIQQKMEKMNRRLPLAKL